MIALSALDAAKDVLRGASDKHTETAKARTRAGTAGTAVGAGKGAGKRVSKDDGEERMEASLQESKDGVSSRGLFDFTTSRTATRDTPGWRAWEAR